MAGLIILSIEYVGGGLERDYGRIPHAFLPLGLKPLFQRQIENWNVAIEHCVLLIPEGAACPWHVSEAVSTVTIMRCNAAAEFNTIVAMAVKALPEGIDDVIVTSGYALYANWSFHNTTSAKKAKWIAYTRELECTPTSSDNGGLKTLPATIALSASLLDVAVAARRHSNLQSIACYCAETNQKVMIPGEDVSLIADSENYYKWKRRARSARSFNDMLSIGRIIFKRSKSFKMHHEIHWLTNIPDSIRSYCPRYLGCKGKSTYFLEYMQKPTLAEIMLLQSGDSSEWGAIYSQCRNFLVTCLGYSPTTRLHASPLKSLTLDKSLRRLGAIAQLVDIDVGNAIVLNGSVLPSITEIIHQSATYINFSTKDFEGVMHGDMSFSNILVTRESGVIHLIDPRGSIDDEIPSIYGDIRYDIAKMYQCACGYYDYIVSDLLTASITGPNQIKFSVPTVLRDGPASRRFIAFLSRFSGVSYGEIVAITIHLFIGMVPLHAESPSRQLAFLASACLLYQVLTSRFVINGAAVKRLPR